MLVGHVTRSEAFVICLVYAANDDDWEDEDRWVAQAQSMWAALYAEGVIGTDYRILDKRR